MMGEDITLDAMLRLHSSGRQWLTLHQIAEAAKDADILRTLPPLIDGEYVIAGPGTKYRLSDQGKDRARTMRDA